jgi:hypothetical protein
VSNVIVMHESGEPVRSTHAAVARNTRAVPQKKKQLQKTSEADLVRRRGISPPPGGLVGPSPNR